MTQYAKQGDKVFYGRCDEILDGAYQCLECVYNLEVVRDKNCNFLYFKHEANSRKAHIAAHGKLCGQMSVNFKNNGQSQQKEYEYNKTTFERLLLLAKQGELDPNQVIGHLLYLKSYIDNFSAQLVEIKRANRNIEIKEDELNTREKNIEQRQLDLENNEKSSFLRLTKEVDEYTKAAKAKQEKEWDRINVTKATLLAVKHSHPDTVQQLQSEIEAELDNIPPWEHEHYLNRRPFEPTEEI